MTGKVQWMGRMNMANFKRTHLVSRTVTSIARIKNGCLFSLSKIQVLLSYTLTYSLHAAESFLRS